MRASDEYEEKAREEAARAIHHSRYPNFEYVPWTDSWARDYADLAIDAYLANKPTMTVLL